MLDNPVLKAIEQIGETVVTYQKTNKKEMAEMRERLENMEAGADRPKGVPVDAASGGYSKKDVEHKSLFCEWLRGPANASRANRLAEAQREIAAERKDVSTGSNLNGGYALPKQIDDQIIRRVTQLNPFRGLVYNPQASTTDFHSLVDIGDSTSGWVGETDSRTATNTATLRDRQPTWGEVYAYPTASNWSLEDLAFDVGQWLTDSASEQFASAETTAIVSGNGTKKPTGFLNTTPVTTDDDASPMRAAAALRYIPLGAYTSPDKLNGETLIDVVSSIKERYLIDAAACAWVMNNLTLAKIRKLKTTQGEFIFQESLTAGAPSTILGFPVKLTAAMPAATSGLFPIAFGNWNAGYVLADRPGLQITLDQVTSAGFTKFYIRRRVSGCVRLNDALRVVKYSST